MYFLVCYESRAVYFQHKDVIHNPYFTTLDELHLALMAVDVYGEAYACTDVYVSRLGEKLDVERHTLHLSRCLRMHVACHYAPASWVYPSPLLGVATNFRI